MRRLPLFLVVLLVSAPLLAQRRLFDPVPCRIRITVVDRDTRTAIQNASVQLMDAVGGFAAGSEKLTDSSGQVEFSSYTGKHQIRIRSDEIKEYSNDFDVADNEPYHQERIYVVRKPSAESHDTVSPTQTIPAVRLRIPPNARKEVDKGVADLDHQRWSQSQQHFQKAIDLYPDYDLAYYGIAQAAMEMKDTGTARSALKKALQLNPGFANAQHDLAHIYLSDLNYAEALSLLKQYLTTNADSAWALTNAAYAELQLHQFAEAATDARKVHTLPHSTFANSHIIAGYALRELGKKREAEDEFNLYLKEEPAGPNAARVRAALSTLQSSK